MMNSITALPLKAPYKEQHLKNIPIYLLSLKGPWYLSWGINVMSDQRASYLS